MVLPFERFQSALTDIPGGHPVGVLAVAAGHAEKRRLSLAIVGMSMPALGALLAGMPGRHGHQPATGPLNLVIELTAKLTPALVQDRAIQPGLLPNVPAGLPGAAPGRPAMWPTCRSSIHTSAWLLLMACDALCR